MLFPVHKSSLYLSHNDHLSNYETVKQQVDDERCDYTNWVSEYEKEKAIETNDCWTLHWYPETPIGFYTLAAHNLGKLLEAAREIDTLANTEPMTGINVQNIT